MPKLPLLMQLMDRSQRVQLLFIGALALLSALAELIAIASVVPFFSFAANAQTKPMWSIFETVLVMIHEDPMIAATLLFGLSYSMAAAIRMILQWRLQRFIEMFGHDLAATVFRRTIRQGYLVHVHRSSSVILTGIMKVQEVVFGYLQPILQASVNAFIALAVMTPLMIAAPVPTVIVSALILFIYSILHVVMARRVASNARVIASMATSRTKIVQETLDGMRETILGNTHHLHEARFEQMDADYRRAHRSNMLIAQMPRSVIELGGVALIATFILVASRSEAGITASLPALSVVTIAALRLMPLVQGIWNGLKLSSGHRQNLLDVAALAGQAVDADAVGKDGSDITPLDLVDRVTFQSVSFQYPDGTTALDKLDLEILQGEHVGICGETGAGKSTLLDIFLGLLTPKEGQLLIDGVPLTASRLASWQASLAHVPQNVFLIDDTILANVALGQRASEVDSAQVWAALDAAQLAEFVKKLPNQIETVVGERGVMLSGGQRQRIGIARALYQQAPILVLDEATSALDDATEAAVLDKIAKAFTRLTIVSVAHRQTTLDKCDRVILLENGEAVRGPTVARETR